jgi:hypothetical protein
VKQSSYDKNRDEGIAEAASADRALMCPAVGCPRRWSLVGQRGKACGSHYWADRRDWPRITQELQRLEVDLAMAEAGKPSPPLITPAERRNLGATLRQLVQPRDPSKAWAHRLHERHLAGERMTQAQVDAYRNALQLDRAGQPQNTEGTP